jgi:hypothetical protein
MFMDENWKNNRQTILHVRNIVEGPNTEYTYMEHLATLGKSPLLLLLLLLCLYVFPL